MDNELPAMIKAAGQGGLQLLWVYISPAGWDQTPLKRFQATHDTKKPLDSRSVPEQNEILLSVLPLPTRSRVESVPESVPVY